MSLNNNLLSLPFSNIGDKMLCKIMECPSNDTSVYESNKNDFLADIDPDINCANTDYNKKCVYYTIEKFNNNICNNTDEKLTQLSLFHTNIRSSASKNLNDLLCYLSTLKIKFGIIGLSENWGKEDDIDLRNIAGYKHYYYIRPKAKRGGGASLYIKEHIDHKPRTDLTMDKNISESVFIEIDKKVFNTNRSIIVGTIYKPP